MMPTKSQPIASVERFYTIMYWGGKATRLHDSINVFRIIPGIIFRTLMLTILISIPYCSKGGGGSGGDGGGSGGETTTDTTSPTTGTSISFANVSGTSLTVLWGAASDNATAQANLEYRLVKDVAAANIDTIAEVDAKSGGDLLQNYTANITKKNVNAGLTTSTGYAFAVVVRDAAGNKTLYTPATQATTATADITGPTSGTAISFSGVASSSLTVNWGAAVDTGTTAAHLEYRIVKDNTTTTNIDSIAEVDAKSGGDLLQDYSANITSQAVNGLSASTTYHFAVVVRDVAGNKTLYTPASQTTSAIPDTTPPTAGAAISFSSVTGTTLAVNWGAATDNVTPQANLEYRIVKDNTAMTNIDSVAEVDAKSGGDLLQDYTTNITTRAVTGLSAGTTYHFAVVVRDAAGNKTIYSPATQATVNNPPTAPVDFTAATSGSDRIQLTWVASTDDTTTTPNLIYEICRATSAGGCNTFSVTYTTAAGATEYDINSGLITGTTYYFKVRARDSANNTSVSSSETSARAVTTPTWSQQAYLKAPNAGVGDRFGYATAISGDTVVVGAYLEDSNQTTITNGATATADNSVSNTGAAYVFRRTGTIWAQEAFLKAPNAEAEDRLGNAVAISGDLIAVGAYQEDSNQTTITQGSGASSDNSASNAGAVYLFRRTGTTWAQEAYLKAPVPDANDFFGWAVGATGDTVVVSAIGEDSNQTIVTNSSIASTDNSSADSGAVYVFKRTGTTWAQEAYVKAPNPDASDRFGYALMISGDTLIVGAYAESSNQTTITNGTTASANNGAGSAGAAYIFRRSGTIWAQEAYLKAPNADAGDFFGWSVAIWGNTAVVGAYNESSSQTTVTNGTTASADNSATASGAAYIFKRSGSTWGQEAYLKAPNADASDRFGSSVSISGDTVIVGAFGEASNQSAITNGGTASANNSAGSSGAAYVFKRNGISWAQEAYLKVPNPDASDSFGYAAAISGDTIVVGAYDEDSNQTTITNGATASADNSAATAGAAYIFVRQ